MRAGTSVVETLNLSRLVQELVHLLHVSISKKALLRCHLAEDLPSIEADPAQVRQIVMNLVINASEAIGDNDGVIGITTARSSAARRTALEPHLETPPPGRYVLLEVADTGCGMDAETQPGSSTLLHHEIRRAWPRPGCGLGIVRKHRAR